MQNLTIRRVQMLYVSFTAASSFAASFIMTTYVPFLEAHGMNALERGVINACFFATNFLAEGPTGAIADVLGQKKAYVWSTILFGGGFLYYASAHTFWACVLAEVIAALGRTLANGCLDGWMVNHLYALGASEQTRRDTFRLEYILRSGMSVVGGIAGSLLSGGWAGSPKPWIVAGCLSICNGLVVWKVLPAEHVGHQMLRAKEVFTRLCATVRKSAKYVRENDALKYNFCLTLAFATAVQALNMQWTIYYRATVGKGVSLALLGGGILLSMVIGAALSRRWRHDALRLERTLYVVGTCVVLCAIARTTKVGILWFLLHELFRGAFQTVQTDYVQQHALQNERSTIKSISSMPYHIGGVVGLLLSGSTALAFGIRWTWACAGLFLLCAVVAAKKIRPKN